MVRNLEAVRVADKRTREAFGQFFADLGAQDAIGLDGGGSTTMYLKDCWLNDIVNYQALVLVSVRFLNFCYLFAQKEATQMLRIEVLGPHNIGC